MLPSERLVRLLVYASATLGGVFLVVARPLLPPDVFSFIALGEALFIVDSALTVFRPGVSYYLGFVLALLALGSSLPQPAHYAFISEGDVVPATIFIAGSALQVLLLIAVPYHLFASRKPPQ